MVRGLLFLVALGAIVGGTASTMAHPHDYAVLTPMGSTVPIPAGHVVPDANDQATLMIDDSITNPTSGYYCQDFDADGICGEAAIGEPDAIFCGSIVLTAGINWNLAFDILLLVDGTQFGNPALSPCGFVFSEGTIGTLDHT